MSRQHNNKGWFRPGHDPRRKRGGGRPFRKGHDARRKVFSNEEQRANGRASFRAFLIRFRHDSGLPIPANLAAYVERYTQPPF